MIHELKAWPEGFSEVWSGEKLCEVRKADRPFRKHDVLALLEWDPATAAYTGRIMMARVTHLVPPGQYGLPDGLCVMSIEVVTRSTQSDPGSLKSVPPPV